MPNHCRNYLSIENGNPIRNVLEPYFSRDEDGKLILDFDKILPHPPGIRIDLQLGEIRTKRLTGELPEETEEEAKQRKEMMQFLAAANMQAYGYADWYDWRNNVWGTKWNSYFCDSDAETHDRDNFGFDTAWGPPIGVIRELSRLTGETFRMTYVDEGWNFGGVFTVGPDGEADEYYTDPKDVPEHLREELDVPSVDDQEEE